MELIAFETIQHHSQEWAVQATRMAIMRAVQSNNALFDDYMFGYQERLTPKEWNRLCAFFVAPHSELSGKGSVRFIGDLANAPSQKVIRFIQKTIEKKVLNTLLLDTPQSFEERVQILQTALQGLWDAPRWSPKLSVMGTPHYISNDQLAELIEHFIGHHLSVTHPLQPYKVATKLPAALTPRASTRDYAGPM